MISKETLRVIVKAQRAEKDRQDKGIRRKMADAIDMSVPHAVIISGIRRCGKSTLLRQLMSKTEGYYFLNFEEPQLLDFDIQDFARLNEVFKEEWGEQRTYFFDEIQNVKGWEVFVRRMQDAKKKFVITGSNASLLSRELGTKLTGRHITYELFPFSFQEMLEITDQSPSADSSQSYLELGGFPEYLIYGRKELLQRLFKDILARDIIVRYHLRESRIIEELALFLLSNTGKEFSSNSLKKMFSLGSTNTVIAYISYLEECYLLFTLPRFAYSFKKQIIAPKKSYGIDAGFISANSVAFSSDKGRMLETVVFLALRRRYTDLFYFKGDYECDFLAKEQGKIIEAIQVCYELTDENKEREIRGLSEAMKTCKLTRGTVITLYQEDSFENIRVIPFWRWALEKSLRKS